VNYILAVTLGGFGMRKRFILALITVEFSYFEGGCYCSFGVYADKGLKQDLAYTCQL